MIIKKQIRIKNGCIPFKKRAFSVIRKILLGIFFWFLIGSINPVFSQVNSVNSTENNQLIQVFATQNITIPVEAVLETAAGPIDGEKRVEIRLIRNFGEETQSIVWEETQDVFFDNGYVSVLIGNTKQILPKHFIFNRLQFLMKVEGVPGEVKLPLSHVPWAVRSAKTYKADKVRAQDILGKIEGVQIESNQENITGVGVLQRPLTVKGDLDVSDGVFYVDKESKKVGINTKNPQFELDVSGDIRVKDIIIGNKSLAAKQPKWTLNGELLSYSDNVGIGTSNPKKRLDVRGGVNISGDLNISGELSSESQIDAKESVNVDSLTVGSNSISDSSLTGNWNLNGSDVTINNILKTGVLTIGDIVINQDGISGLNPNDIESIELEGMRFDKNEVIVSKDIILVNSVVFSKSGLESLNNLSADSIINSRKIGVGILDPKNKMEINGGIKLGESYESKTGMIQWTGSNFIGFNGNLWVPIDLQSLSDTGWNSKDEGKILALANNRNNVGIGTHYPSEKLHVNGKMKVMGDVLLGDNRFKDGEVLGDWDIKNNDLKNIKTIDTKSIKSNQVNIQDKKIEGVNKVTISGDLNIGDGMLVSRQDLDKIGFNTPTPQYDLDVNGVINASNYLINNQSLESLIPWKRNSNGINTNLNIGIGIVTSDASIQVKDDQTEFKIKDSALIINSILDEGDRVYGETGGQLLWYPKKAAFRSGYAHSNQYGHNNLGYYSAGFGENNIAAGLSSSILSGADNKVLGSNSSVLAGGRNNIKGSFSFGGGKNISISNQGFKSFGWGGSESPVVLNTMLSAAIFPSGEGVVGIGTSNAKYALDVVGTINATDIFQEGREYLAGRTAWKRDLQANTIINQFGDKVGIGTSSPESKLEVHNTMNIIGDLRVKNSIEMGSIKISDSEILGDIKTESLNIGNLKMSDDINNTMGSIEIEGINFNNGKFSNANNIKNVNKVVVEKNVNVSGKIENLNSFSLGDLIVDGNLLTNNNKEFRVENILITTKNISDINQLNGVDLIVSESAVINDLRYSGQFINNGIDMNLSSLSVSSNVYLSKVNGAVGIGTSNVQGQLTVDGDAKINGDLIIESQLFLGDNNYIDNENISGQWNFNQGDLSGVRDVSVNIITDTVSMFEDGKVSNLRMLGIQDSININENQFFVKKDNEFVGINTILPGFKLDIVGTVNAKAYIVNGNDLYTYLSPWSKSSVNNDINILKKVLINSESTENQLNVSGSINVLDEAFISNKLVLTPSNNISAGQFSGDWEFGESKFYRIKRLVSKLINAKDVFIANLRIRKKVDQLKIDSYNSKIDIKQTLIENSDITTKKMSIKNNQLEILNNSIQGSGNISINDVAFTDNTIVTTKNIYFGNNKHIVTTSGNIGINKTQPAYKLDINGSLEAIDFYENNTSVPLQTTRWIKNVDSIYFNNNVGIQTDTPTEKLLVSGNVIVRNNLDGRNGTGTIKFNQPISIEKGGTGATNNRDIQKNLDLVIGQQVQAYSQSLDGIGKLEPKVESLMVYDGSKWNQTSLNQYKQILELTPESSVTFNSIEIKQSSKVLGKIGIGKIPSKDVDINGITSAKELIVNGVSLDNLKTPWEEVISSNNADILYKLGKVGIGTNKLSNSRLTVSGDIKMINGDIKLKAQALVDGIDISEFEKYSNTVLTVLESEVGTHKNRQDNPHAVTKGLVGLGNVVNINIKDSYQQNYNQYINTDQIQPRDTVLKISNTQGDNMVYIYDNGKVGIGKENLGNYQLEVDGNLSLKFDSTIEKELSSNKLETPLINTQKSTSSKIKIDNISPRDTDLTKFLTTQGTEENGVFVKSDGSIYVGSLTTDTEKFVVDGNAKIDGELSAKSAIVTKVVKTSAIQTLDGDNEFKFKSNDGLDTIIINNNGEIGLGGDPISGLKLGVVVESEFKSPVVVNKMVTVSQQVTVKNSISSTLNIPFAEIDTLKVSSIKHVGDTNITIGKTLLKSGMVINTSGEVSILRQPITGTALAIKGNVFLDGKLNGDDIVQEGDNIETSRYKALSNEGLILKDKNGNEKIKIMKGPIVGIDSEPDPKFELTVGKKGLISKNLSTLSTANINAVLKTPLVQTDSTDLRLFAIDRKGIRINNDKNILEKPFKIYGSLKVSQIKAVSENGIEMQNTKGIPLVKINHNGNLGINVESPKEKVDVSSNMIISGNLYVDNRVNSMNVSRLSEIYVQPQLGEQFDIDGLLIKVSGNYSVTRNRLDEWDTVYSWKDHELFNYIKQYVDSGYIPKSDGTTYQNTNIFQKENNIGINTIEPGYLLELKANNPGIKLIGGSDSWAIVNKSSKLQLNKNSTKLVEVDGDDLVVLKPEMELPNTSLIIKEGNLGIGTLEPKEKISIQKNEPAHFLFKTNFKKLVMNYQADTLLTLESSKDEYARGMHIYNTAQPQTSWFAGVPYEGNGFQIGKSNQGFEMQSNNGAYIKQNKLMFISEGESNIGFGTFTPTADIHIYGEMQKVLQVDSQVKKNLFTIRQDGKIGVNSSEPSVLLNIVGVEEKPTTDRVVFESALKATGNTKHVLVFDKNPTNNYYTIINKNQDDTVKLNSKGASFFVGGNVAIGRKESSAQLDVLGKETKEQLVRINNLDNSYSKLMRFNEEEDYFDIGVGSKDNGDKFHINNKLGKIITIQQDGNLGINQENPSNELAISGNVAIGDIYANNKKAPKNGLIVQERIGIGTWMPSELIEVYADNPKLVLNDIDTSDGQRWTIESRFDSNRNYTSLEFKSDSDNTILDISKDKKVGINQTNPKSDLSVDGGIGIGPVFSKQKVDNDVLSVQKRIGINTSQPAYELDVKGTANIEYLQLGREVSNEQVNQDRPLIYQLVGQSNTKDKDLIIQPATDDEKDVFFVNKKLGSNTPEKFVTVKHSGNIGIGTTNPKAKVDIIKDETFKVKIESLTDKRAALEVKNKDGKGQLFLNQDGSLEIKSDKDLILQPQTGNVGMGIKEPSEVLVVKGDIKLNNQTSVFRGHRFSPKGNKLKISDNTGQYGISILSNGNVGIGNDEANAILQVTDTDTSAKMIVHHNESVDSDSEATLIGLKGAGGMVGEFYRGRSNNKDYFGIQGLNQEDSVSASDLLLQESGGNVGINTAFPSEKLHVQGSMTVSNQIKTVKSGSSSKGNAALLIEDKGGNEWIGLGLESKKLWIRQGTASDKLFVINENGRIGINTSSPSSGLHIYGEKNPQLLVATGMGQSNAFMSFAPLQSTKSGIAFNNTFRLYKQDENFKIDKDNNNSNAITIDKDHNIGIKTPPNNAALQVKDKININDIMSIENNKIASSKDVEIKSNSDKVITVKSNSVTVHNDITMDEVEGGHILPKGSIVVWTKSGNPPTGWEYVTAANNYFIKGSSLANVGQTGGSLTHNHNHSSHGISMDNANMAFSNQSHSNHKHSFTKPREHYDGSATRVRGTADWQLMHEAAYSSHTSNNGPTHHNAHSVSHKHTLTITNSAISTSDNTPPYYAVRFIRKIH